MSIDINKKDSILESLMFGIMFNICCHAKGIGSLVRYQYRIEYPLPFLVRLCI